MLSDSPRIRDWAEAHKIEVRSAKNLEKSDIESWNCDYVFSITWLNIVPDFLRTLPKIAAINIQDSPLPRYSGPNGPAWALMNQELDFGVCWHIAEAEVGLGDILKHVTVPIEANDTTVSLNMKCFEAALSGFEELLPQLLDESFERVPQVESARLPFGRDQRPDHWGLMQWSRSAAELEAMVHGLDYGSYNNPFCMAKMLVSDQAVGISGAIAEPSKESVTAGTILAASERGLVVATADGNLRITGLQDLTGNSVEILDWLAFEGIRIGQVLPSPSPKLLTSLTKSLPAISEHEATWLEAFAAFDPPALAYDQSPNSVADGALLKREIAVPSEFLAQSQAPDFAASLGTVSLIHLSRLARQQGLRVRYVDDHLTERVAGMDQLLSASVPLGVEFQDQHDFAASMKMVEQQVATCRSLPPFLHDLQGRSRNAETQGRVCLPEIAIVIGASDPQAEDSVLVYRATAEGQLWLEYAENRYSSADAEAMAQQLETLLEAICAAPNTPVMHLQLLPEDQRRQILEGWNDSTRDLPQGQLVHELIREKAVSMGNAVAVVAAGEELTYEELEQRADHLASYLASLGAGPDSMVGICMQRTTDMMVALLGILKSGAAYLPLDPDFPPSRLRYMVEDSGVSIVLSDAWSSSLVDDSVETLILMDQPLPAFEPAPPKVPTPSNLAYVIYTSGSTGNPKGVMLEHEQVTNFFLGMDERLGVEPGVWVAVTSLSFDISVLELLWTLSRGYKLVIFEGFDRGLRAAHAPAPHDAGQVEFSLMLWGASGGGAGAPNPYDLMLETARFGDSHGFRAIWLPERHFHDFGGIYPNPAVSAAAIAAVTNDIHLRTGSVVLPFHDPVLMAEDWAMVDNLSGGRVGLGIASGWHPNDFVLEPDSYEDRKQIMKTRIGTLRSAWRGEALELRNGVGETPEIITRPRPVQPELPVWLTAAGNPETFRLAGEMGVHILTHLLGQTTDEIASKIQVYRDAWREAGHPGSGHVTMMLHTMLGEDREELRELARGPFCSYLATAADLLKDHMSAWAAVRTPMNKGKYDTDFNLSDLAGEDVQDLLDFAYKRYFESDALFGTPESCLGMVDKMRDLEVDEIACLVDFGAEPELILKQLPYLQQFKERVQGGQQGLEARENLEDLILTHKATHLQCTPSMATMLLAESAITEALGTLDVMMVGGEALTEDLASKLRAIVPGRVMNMYGLTETAIWSSTADIEHDTTVVSLGEPLANNRFYALDANLQLVPPGLPGELFIAGLCVARGYLGKPDLTSSAFLQDPFDASGEGLLYKSGDQVRQLPDGTMRFMGRGDSQVKVNGYRIELGEIEAAMLSHEEVSQAAVLVVTNPLGARVLAAHFVLEANSKLEIEELRSFLRTCLPEYMIPREFHVHERFPKTNNGKTDRKALAQGGGGVAAAPIPPAPKAQPQAAAVEAVEMSAAELEDALEKIWIDILGLNSLDRNANFFDLGGHSLLTISLKRILMAEHGIEVALIALFSHSTVRSLATFLAAEQEGKKPAAATNGGPSGGAPQSAAAKRAALRRARRGQ
ncbi:MAG: LLM class flavin-dependent oxidoreductase [Planctomycetes bacterium]|nr:LLM class flavin-dependent oxidoreductase [Planctomycetota bacterium]MCP4861743.1 LLM class flavin-dependent oxidoreductase [Planctomycetota bacterium]